MKKTLHIFVGFIITVLLILFDQFTKRLAVIHLKDAANIELIPGVFELSYLENRGAAFGIFQGQKTFFIILTSILLILLVYLYVKIIDEKRYNMLRVIIIVLVAGAIGNFIDRCAHEYVIDFFYFSLIDFPIFNVADIYIVAAVALLMILICFYYKEEDLDNLASKFSFLKKKEQK
ncbi:MAG: signal peptidase II [Lachnospiraceae bacterium]|nr:signal peptidase II [Lachnospiraceae bacterium]